MNYTQYYISIAAIFTGASFVTANAVELPDTLNLKEVNVVATAKTNVELLPLDVTTITHTEIEKSAESSLMPILVNNVAGLFVTERGFAGYGVSGGAAGAVSIRGVGDGNKVLFMIDGQPQWAGVFGHSVADTYVTNGVERVEVVKGPSSLLYGSNAMAGSINIITRKASREGFSGSARAMVGTFTTQKFDVSGSYRHGRFGATVAAQLDRSDGNRPRSAFWDANEFVQLQYDFSNHWTAGATLNLTQSRAENPGTEKTPLLDMWTYIRRGTASINIKDSYAICEGGIQAFFNWGHHNLDDGYNPNVRGPRDYIFHSYDFNAGFTVFQTVHPWQGNDLSAGFDFQRWGGNTWNTLKADDSRIDGSEYRGQESEVGIYAMMQQSLAHNILSLNAGVRYQHGTSYGSIWVPQAGFILKPWSQTQLKFSFGKGFRAPNIRELYMYAPANPDLRPEEMFNYEVSLSQGLFERRLNATVTFFFIDGKNMIQTGMVDGRPRNLNTGAFVNKGFEAELTWHINPHWNLAANYSYLHTDNRDLLAAPKNKLNGRLTYTTGGLSATLESNTIWALTVGTPSNEAGEYLQQSYSLLNLRAGYTFSGRVGFTPFVKLDNITAAQYQIVYGCPMPGFTIMGGIDIKF